MSAKREKNRKNVSALGPLPYLRRKNYFYGNVILMQIGHEKNKKSEIANNNFQ